MPDITTEGRENKAEASKQSATKGGHLTIARPSSSEQGEQKWHGQIHDAVGRSANDFRQFSATLKRPVLKVVFL